MSFTKTFLDQSIATIRNTDVDSIEQVADLLRATRERDGRVFFCGSGGGAGHASHAACDFRKLAAIECYSVTDNVSELTARTNDEGWESSYAEWLKVSRIQADDTLFVFSVGGGSVSQSISLNLVRAMELARSVGASITGIVGRDGGQLAVWADCCIIIPDLQSSMVTPQTEGLQALYWHLLVSHPSLSVREAKWEATAAPAVLDLASVSARSNPVESGPREHGG